MIYGNGGMFGGMYGGGYQSPMWGQRYGGGGWQGQGFTGNGRMGGMFGGYQRAQPFDPYNPQPQGGALADYANRNVMQFANYGQPQQSPQMSQEFAYQSKGGLVAAPQDGNSAPGFMVNQMASTQPAPVSQAPQQSFEQFAATLGNNGMTSGQMQDAYQKSIQPTATNFWGNVGPGGTKNPYPQNPNWTPPQWGTQTYGFDPRAMAGKQVTGDLGWYYGRDAIGRTINNQGDAVAGFSPAADGFQRMRPWFA